MTNIIALWVGVSMQLIALSIWIYLAYRFHKQGKRWEKFSKELATVLEEGKRK
jgi:hypothetical protein